MKSLKSIYRSLLKKDKNKCSYISVDQRKVHNIKDLTVEAAKTFKNKTYIRYQVENEVQDVTFEDMLEVCEIYNAWIYKEIENIESERAVHVGLLGIGSYNYYIAYLATMFSGNVTIPMDPNLDLDTLTYCINHGDVDVIFYETKFQEKIDKLKERCPNVKHYILTEKDEENPSLDNMDDILKLYKGQKVIKNIKPNDNALMIYTSGTTGPKKGVVLTHDNLVDKFFSTLNFKGNQTEIYLCVLPLYHIFSSNDFLFSLRFGFTVCFNFDLSKLVQNLQLYQPTKTSLVPLLAKNLLNIINMNVQEHPNIPMEEAKRQIVGKNFYKIQSGGGYLSPELTEGFRKYGILIGQGYGLTETASKATLSDFNPKKCASVGVIAPNSQIRIKDGEIQIKSRAVMKEYYKDPVRTKEAFTEDGWLHTGDLGHFDKDGYLYLTGRQKNLIILSNGENVSPEVIETLYASEPLIQEVLVYGYEDVLCAEVYPNFKYAEKNGIEKDKIKENVWSIIEAKNKDLPSYEKIVRLSIRDEPFAKTASKKIIRAAFLKELEKREKNREADERNINMPTNEVQEKLYNIASRALGNKNFGIDSDLYEYGLDSFSCTILMNEIRKEFDIPITLNYVVHNSSVVKLESFVNDYKKEEHKEDKIDLSKRDVYPTVLSQLYSFNVYKGFTQGNIPCLFRLDKDIDLQKLKESIEKLIDINFELKATIHLNEEGKYMNYRHDDRKADIKITKLTDKEWEETRKGLTYPYNLTEDELLYHIGIYETESNKYLYFDVAHLMCDGISYKNLIEDLNAIYCGKTIEPKEYSFFEYALECNHNFLEVYKEERKYHHKLLDGLTLHDNPFMRKDAYNSKPYVDAQFIDTYTKIDVDKFHKFCEEKAITENALFLFAAAHALNLYENIKDCAIISLHNGRTSDRWTRVCGYVANYFQFRLTETEDEKVIDAIHRSGKQIMETMCTNLPFIKHNNFFFQYQGTIRDFNTIGDKPAVQEPVLIDSTFNQLSVFQRNNKFKYVMNYWSNVYDTQQLDNYIHIIEDIVVAIINGTEYVKDLRSQVSEEYFTSKRSTSVEELNEAIGKKFITCDDEKNTIVNTYILNSELEKQFIGGWGDLYVEENDYVKCKECIDNPFGEGKLYKTGYTGKYLPDENKTINVLENDCRFIMWDLLGYERYQNVNIIEKTLMEYEGIEKATTDFRFVPQFDVYKIISNIYGEKEPDMEKVKEFLKSKIEERLIPYEIIFHKLE